jgi:hypothetical protein
MSMNGISRIAFFVVTSLILICYSSPTVQNGVASSKDKGIAVLLPHACTQEEEMNRGDGRTVFVRLLPGDKSYINLREIPRVAVAEVVGQAMDNRMEQVVELSGNSQISYGELAAVVDAMKVRSPHLAIFLVTASVLRNSNDCFAL